MRATLSDVARHPTWLPDWWVELPWRRRPLRKMRALLATPGRGWLRWGMLHCQQVGGWYGLQEPEFATVAPPARRAWLWTSSRAWWLLHLGGWYRIPADEGHPAEWERVEWSWMFRSRDLKDPGWPHDFLP